MANKPQVHRITNVSQGLKAQQAQRSRRYLWSMIIRMACFVTALFTDGVWRWSLLVGSLVLPWIAVVLANAGRENRLDREEQTVISHPYSLD